MPTRPALASLTALATTCLVAGVACGGAPGEPAAPRRPATAPALPHLVTDMTNGIRLWVTVNGMPLSQREVAEQGPVQNIVALPPYYFRTGTNTISIRYLVNEDTAQYYPDTGLHLDVALADLAATQPEESWLPRTLANVVARFATTIDQCPDTDEAHPCDQSLSFPVAAAIPAWSWTAGDPITDTAEARASLRAAYAALWQRLHDMVPRDGDGLPTRAARRAGGVAKFRKQMTRTLADQAASARLEGKRSIADLDDLIYLDTHPDAGLDDLFDVDGAELEILAGGTLARLWHGIPLIRLVGGANDAPAGTLGPFSVGFDVWFRLDHGKWIPAALWRTDVMPTLP